MTLKEWLYLILMILLTLLVVRLDYDTQMEMKALQDNMTATEQRFKELETNDERLDKSIKTCLCELSYTEECGNK